MATEDTNRERAICIIESWQDLVDSLDGIISIDMYRFNDFKAQRKLVFRALDALSDSLAGLSTAFHQQGESK